MDTSQIAEESGILDALRNRANHPVFGILTLSIILVNWRFLLFLAFDGRPMEDRIAHAVEWYLPWWGWPVAALMTLGYLMLSPILSALAQRWDALVKRAEERNWSEEDVKFLEFKIAELETRQLRLSKSTDDLQIREHSLKESINKLQQGEMQLRESVEDILNFSDSVWQAPRGSGPGTKAYQDWKDSTRTHIINIKNAVAQWEPSFR